MYVCIYVCKNLFMYICMYVCVIYQKHLLFQAEPANATICNILEGGLNYIEVKHILSKASVYIIKLTKNPTPPLIS